MLASAWEKVSQTTIVSCFKLKLQRERDHTMAMNDEDDLFKEINNPKELREKERNLVSESMTTEDFATANDAVIAT